MAFMNEANGDLHFKILYVGSQNSGKTTNIQYLFCEKNKDLKETNNISEFISDLPRNSFFDFLPISYKKIPNKSSRMHLYTLPSHNLWPSVNINLMLGVDGIVYVIDSRIHFLEKNMLHMQNIKNLFKFLQLDEKRIPSVYQLNHSDSLEAMVATKLKQTLSIENEDCIDAAALHGAGVLATYDKITQKITEKYF